MRLQLNAQVIYNLPSGKDLANVIKKVCFKRNAQFGFLWKPQKLLFNVCLMKILKSTVTKKEIVCFYNLGEKNF